jgi:hypothetical protein
MAYYRDEEGRITDTPAAIAGYNPYTGRYEIHETSGHGNPVGYSGSTLDVSRQARDAAEAEYLRLYSIPPGVVWLRSKIRDPLARNGLGMNIYGKPVIDYRGELVTGVKL